MSDDKPWQEFKRGVRRLPSAAKKSSPHEKAMRLTAPPPDFLPPEPPISPTVSLPPQPAQPRRPAGMVDDPQLQQRLQAGKVRVDARLDLHGMTESVAHQAVTAFLARAQTEPWRILLIITGRGTVLRTALPRWVLAIQGGRGIRWCEPAAPRHGGGGAYYIVLKRPVK